MEPAVDAPRLTFPLATLWTAALADAPSAPPGFDLARAYVPLRNGQLQAVSLENGSIAWTIEVTMGTSPAVGMGLLFVARDGFIEALTATDGRSRWRTPVGGAITAPLLFDTGWLIAATGEGDLVALRANDGTVVWRRQIGAAPLVQPTLAPGRLYVPVDDGRVVALGLNDGGPLWERRLGGAPTEAVALLDRLFVGSKDNFFYCLDAEDGGIRWKWRTGADLVGRPAVDDRRVYFVSLDNMMRALDRSSGVLKWQSALPIRAAAGPALIDRLALVGGVSAEFRAYRTDDGVAVGEYTAAAELAAPLHVHVLPGPRAQSPVATTAAGVLELMPNAREWGIVGADAPPAFDFTKSRARPQILIVIATREGKLEALASQ